MCAEKRKARSWKNKERKCAQQREKARSWKNKGGKYAL